MKAAGIIPFLMTGGEPMVFSWAKGVLGDQIWQDRLAEIDVNRKPPGGYPGIDAQEFVRAWDEQTLRPELLRRQLEELWHERLADAIAVQHVLEGLSLDRTPTDEPLEEEVP